MNLEMKLDCIRHEFRNQGQVVLAFSGGVDSSLLAYIGMEELGDNFQAVTIDNGLQSEFEIANARSTARSIGFRHRVLKVEALMNEEVRGNTLRRCYYCKKMMMSRLLILAAEKNSCVMEGSHSEDSHAYRPGQQAITELGILSPLKKADLNKIDIRQLAHNLGLPNWGTPASPCLATRFPYGEQLTPARLQRVEEAENIIRKAGFQDFRVRSYGDSARIEVARDQRERFFNTGFMDEIEHALSRIGYLHVSLDLYGYRTGSMDYAQKSKGGK